MKLDEAKAECARWFAHLDRQRAKAKALAKLASDLRSGACGEDERKRRLREIEGVGVTVFCGAKLERAVKVLLKHIKS